MAEVNTPPSPAEAARDALNWIECALDQSYDLPGLGQGVADALRAALEAKPDVLRFAEAIMHGDAEHRAWLREAAEAFVAGREIPSPRSGASVAGGAVPSLDEEIKETLRKGEEHGRRLIEAARPSGCAGYRTGAGGAAPLSEAMGEALWQSVKVVHQGEIAMMSEPVAGGTAPLSEMRSAESAHDRQPIEGGEESKPRDLKSSPHLALSEADAQRLATIREQRDREVNEPYWQKVKHFAWIDMDLVLRLLDTAQARIAELERELEEEKASHQYAYGFWRQAVIERDSLQAQLAERGRAPRKGGDA